MRFLKNRNNFKKNKTNESVVIRDNEFIVSGISIPQSFINSYATKVKKETGKDIKQIYSMQDIAQELSKFIMSELADVEQIPASAILGGEAEMEKGVDDVSYEEGDINIDDDTMEEEDSDIDQSEIEEEDDENINFEDEEFEDPSETEEDNIDLGGGEIEDEDEDGFDLGDGELDEDDEEEEDEEDEDSLPS